MTWKAVRILPPAAASQPYQGAITDIGRELSPQSAALGELTGKESGPRPCVCSNHLME